MNAIRIRARTAGTLLAGALLGFALSIPFTFVLAVRAGRVELQTYTERILRVLEKAAREDREAELAVYYDHLPFCSDDEIALMRQLVYNASFVRDLGRSRDGMLYCTAARGQLENPVPVAPPTVEYRNRELGLDVYVSVGRGLVIAPGLRGIVVDVKGVSSVVNQALFDGLDEGPLHATGVVSDRDHAVVLSMFGDTGKLSSADVLGQVRLERDGTIYQSLCSGKYAVCAVGSVRRQDLIQQRGKLFGEFALLGALLGALIASTILLVMSRERSFGRRLLRAVRRGELNCVYQPVVDLESGTILGAEALARWVMGSGESVPPDVFIRVAEERKFVGEITRLMIDRVIDELGQLLYSTEFRVTVNISSQDLLDPQFFAHLEQSTAWTGIAASALAFELTEHSTADQASAASAIARLRASGHAIYIDDFGTGYSSLSYLHDLHVDAIKIDRVFTKTVGTQAVTASVVPQILAMADKLGLTVIVEGIETAEQAEYFRKARARTLGQGYYFGKPMPAEKFIALVQSQRAVRRVSGTR